ncbi:hypothetical protein [Streptacidiphilus sp. PB12-B1b]|uniref:hypothetical protein n=1 Tax=Streptacidiphilus sp. PB12-B1b TaxID=2705012 RepID=UPI0015FB6C0B|nr:hypothetical protein [Streptacidiphilus sp. PB12-B1b]
MSTGVIILIVVAVVVVAALVAFTAARPRMRSRRLQERFGPEYERELAEHEGDRAAAESELEERVKRAQKLDIQPLDAAQRERFLADWNTLQEQFVDSPAKAVIGADQLLNEVLRDSGYPEDDRYGALSVHHNKALPGYRASREAAVHARQGEATTEELRTSFVDVRNTFDLLVGAGEGSDRQQSLPNNRVPAPRPAPSSTTTEETS